MSSSIRRKGKPGKGDGKGPSRGGRGGRGHANKSHGGGYGGGGGGGGGGGRKASSRIWDDGDDFCVFTESKHPPRSLRISYILFVWCLHVCCSVHVEIKGHYVGAGSFLLPCGPWC